MVGREKTEEQFLLFEELAKQSFCTTGVFSLVGIFWLLLFAIFIAAAAAETLPSSERVAANQSGYSLSLPFQRRNINFNYQKTQYNSEQRVLRPIVYVLCPLQTKQAKALGRLIQENERRGSSQPHSHHHHHHQQTVVVFFLHYNNWVFFSSFYFFAVNPSHVTIMPPTGSYLSDGLKTEVNCRAYGGKPYSLISWFLDGRNVTHLR